MSTLTYAVMFMEDNVPCFTTEIHSVDLHVYSAKKANFPACVIPYANDSACHKELSVIYRMVNIFAKLGFREKKIHHNLNLSEKLA